MHFSKLRLIGFKSFVEPTDFLIEPGLTGVVGPNGCGKSNLVEALRWVMGDHSYKSMRASGMNDVIFSGAGQRPARNVAEVGLTLDNSSRTAPVAFNDAEVLEVTRRIEREAGSTYRVNGREVRARDVQILFADAASGARSPSLVRQGQVSEIISAKPQARRRILEDAAGVAGLHTRRHEAELRLKGAEDNLARIADVIAQITSQGDGLRRQVRQAQRYRGLQAEIRRTQALVALVEHEDAHQEVEEAKARLAEASAAVVTCTQAQGEAARHQAVAAHGLPDLRDREVAAGTTLQRVIVARETLDGEERRAKARSDELNRRIAEMTRDLGRDASVLEDACAVLERLASEEMELQGAVKDAGAEDDLRRRLTSTEAARVAAETRVAAAQTRHAEAQAERRALASRLKDEEGRLARHAQDFAASQKARDTLVTQAGAGESLEAQIAKLESAKAALAELETVTREAEAAMAAAREVEQAGRAPLFEADRHVQRLETEIRTLSKLLETSGEQQWPPIVDLIHVAAGYEAALGAALGDDLDASADPQAPAHWAVSEARGDGALPDGAEPLSRFVEAPAALARRLAQIGLVEKQAGEAMRAALGPGQRLVSIQGDLWRWDGFTQAADSPTPAALRLVERNRLTELRAEAAQARDALAELKASAGAAQEHLRACLTREAGTRSSLQGARRVFEAAREAHAARERKAIEAAARLAALDAESAKLRSARDEADRKVGDIRAALAALAPAGAGEEELEMSRVELTSCHAAETEARALCQAIDRDREVKSKRLAAIATERASWLSRREHAQAHHLDLAGRLEAARTEHVGMSENPDAFVLARRRLLGEAEAAETALRAASDARTRAETDLAAADRGARATLEAMSAAREGNARCEARLEAANQRLDALVRQVATELECAPTALCSLAGLKPNAPRPPLAQIMARLEGLKDDRERLGAVNLRADEELGALEAQRQGLDKEKADLTEAIRRLRQAIGSLNREGRERLLGAFATVNGHFKELFTSLFGGGTAELQLVESDDPLEAGLEIVARPPGKKTQVMTLLSGGEQALTSISLIFAVFLTNPSPICVLDEVDAPLDDANVERLCDLVDAMRKKTDTRFIAITHNPLTMARMDRLYGVTQTEPGVSQLVSVDLARAEQMLEAS